MLQIPSARFTWSAQNAPRENVSPSSMEYSVSEYSYRLNIFSIQPRSTSSEVEVVKCSTQEFFPTITKSSMSPHFPTAMRVTLSHFTNNSRCFLSLSFYPQTSPSPTSKRIAAKSISARRATCSVPYRGGSVCSRAPPNTKSPSRKCSADYRHPSVWTRPCWAVSWDGKWTNFKHSLFSILFAASIPAHAPEATE